MRLRRTAPPSAFFRLQPKRLIARPLGRRKAVNSRLVRRRPSRYTTSYSMRRTRRQARGKSSRGTSDPRETVAPLFAALGKNLASTLRFHAYAEAMFLMTAAHMGLKRAFRQRSFSSIGVLVIAYLCGGGFRAGALAEILRAHCGHYACKRSS
jgi:hypothetical protein